MILIKLISYSVLQILYEFVLAKCDISSPFKLATRVGHQVVGLATLLSEQALTNVLVVEEDPDTDSNDFLDFFQQV